MAGSLADQIETILAGRSAEPGVAVVLVDTMLKAACDAAASDVHLVPDADGLQVLWRMDGVLQPVTRLPRGLIPNVVARLKVLAGLLTYRTEVPQEGRIRTTADGAPVVPDLPTGDGIVEMRLSTFPTLFGEKAVVRLFVGSGRYRVLDDLGLPTEINGTLRGLLMESGGVLMAAGPAGSGKTTTIYACLRELTDNSEPGRSLVSLEDPIEAVVPGVAQSQVQPAAGFDYATGLKSLMRQDPEVILVGEIRDQLTAETVFQAALTGQLVLTTFHAGSAAGAVCRLTDMGIEPYLLRTGLLGILAQRLVRRLCGCSTAVTDGAGEDDRRLGLNVETFRVPIGCDRCRRTGYAGRLLLAEFLRAEATELGRAILSRSDADELEVLAVKSGMVTRWQRALSAVSTGLTSPTEVRRIFGFTQT